MTDDDPRRCLNLEMLPDQVECIALFGSCSRGDADPNSDIDVVVFATVERADELVSIKQSLCKRAPAVSFSVYSVIAGEHMASDGSLFLWHLKGEATLLFSRSGWIESVLANLRAYSLEKAQRDLETFDLVLFDVKRNLENDASLLLYETATLFSVLRSIGMIAAIVDGRPNFQRTEPIAYVMALAGPKLKFTDADIRVLMMARHVYARNVRHVLDLSKEQSVFFAEQAAVASNLVRDHVSGILH